MVNGPSTPTSSPPRPLLWSPSIAFAAMLAAVTGPILASYLSENRESWDSDPTPGYIMTTVILIVLWTPAIGLVCTRAPDLRRLGRATLLVLAAIGLQWGSLFVLSDAGVTVWFGAFLTLPLATAIGVGVFYVRTP